MTDNEIIKALEDEIHLAEYVDSDYCSNVNLGIIKSALDLITRQQAELDNLKVENQSLRTAANSLKMHYEEAQAEIERLQQIVEDKGGLILIDNAKSEAYKEFAERIKKLILTKEFSEDVAMLLCAFIDDIVKEMVGENNG